MRNKSSTIEEVLPSIVKEKLEKQKIECRISSKIESKFNNYLTTRSNQNVANKKIKVSLEILNYSNLKTKPTVPRYGRFISEILQIFEIDAKGATQEKTGIITYCIKASEVDQYCYPLLCNNDSWRIAENFSIENDGISVTEGDWNIVILVKEPLNEIITIGVNGGMIHSELDKVTSLRVPKGTFKEDKYCKIQFVNISGSLEDFKLVYEEQLSPFSHISEFFIVQLIDSFRDFIKDEKSLRRAVSIKIPLPKWISSILQEINFDTKKTIQNQKQEKLGFYFLQKIGANWTFFEGNMQFTQNSLTFDTKDLGSFSFVNCRENREIRLCPQMTLVEHLHMTERGVVLAFLWMKNRNWFIWIEIVPVHKIRSTRELLQSNGLLFIEQSYECSLEEGTHNTHRQNHKLAKKNIILRRTIELYEGIQFKVSLSGQIERKDHLPEKKNGVTTIPNNNNAEDDGNKVIDLETIGKRKKVVHETWEEGTKVTEPDLSYHKSSIRSNATLIPIKPIERPLSEWTSIILKNLSKRSLSAPNASTTNEAAKVSLDANSQVDIDSSLIEPDVEDKFNSSKLSLREKELYFACVMKLYVLNCPSDMIIIPQIEYKFYIPVDTMKEYFNVMTKEEEHELKLEELRFETEHAAIHNQDEQKVQLTNGPTKPRTVNYRRIEILSNPRTRIKGIERYPKIISVKSMQALSSVVRQGLTMAVYLSLPENVIAGIGFDSLSQMSMNGVNSTTYKVLVTWKKMIHLNKITEDVYVEQLKDALKMLGYGNLSAMIHDHWKNNQDISLDDCHRCLLKIESS